mmetsp:Transcript_122766/g.281509  ORF Transcript_122766/g.281509 Transcript_122766/m.281509 type:complete len:215 (-) Transcript_122766:393-1037(-)
MKTTAARTDNSVVGEKASLCRRTGLRDLLQLTPEANNGQLRTTTIGASPAMTTTPGEPLRQETLPPRPCPPEASSEVDNFEAVRDDSPGSTKICPPEPDAQASSRAPASQSPPRAVILACWLKLPIRPITMAIAPPLPVPPDWELDNDPPSAEMAVVSRISSAEARSCTTPPPRDTCPRRPATPACPGRTWVPAPIPLAAFPPDSDCETFSHES